MIPVEKRIATICRALQTYRFAWASEVELQEGVAEALERSDIEFEREHSLSDTKRVDFFVDGGIAVELKTTGSPAAVLRQLHGYATVASVTAVVLVTSSLRLRTPEMLAGKPAKTIHLVRL